MNNKENLQLPYVVLTQYVMSIYITTVHKNNTVAFM